MDKNPVTPNRTNRHSNAHSEQPLALNLEQAAKLLGLSEPMLRRLLNAGEIAHRRVGRRVLISRSALEDFLRGAE